MSMKLCNVLVSSPGYIPRIDSVSAAFLTRIKHLVGLNVKFDSAWERDGIKWDVLSIKIWLNEFNGD